ncbi:MAG: SDR family oxidoreductase [Planctomycetota bacterium]
MKRFDGKVAWITGASSGIGREMALEFARRGADLAISARRAERLEELQAKIEGLGRQALSVPCDVTDESAQEAAVAKIVERFGRLDVAVANAGFGVGGRFENLSVDEWRRQLDTNVIGSVITAKKALPELRKTQGRIALVGSILAMVALPSQSAYAASKYAVRALGQSLAMELHGSGVTCTLLHPGFVASELNQVDNQGQFHPDRKDRRPKRFMWATDKAARVMVNAIAARKREYVFTGHGKVGGWVGRHLPGLVHFVVARQAHKMKK